VQVALFSPFPQTCCTNAVQLSYGLVYLLLLLSVSQNVIIVAFAAAVAATAVVGVVDAAAVGFLVQAACCLNKKCAHSPTHTGHPHQDEHVEQLEKFCGCTLKWAAEAVKDFGGVASWVLTLLFANNAMYVKAKYVHSTQQTKQQKKRTHAHCEWQKQRAEGTSIMLANEEFRLDMCVHTERKCW